MDSSDPHNQHADKLNLGHLMLLLGVMTLLFVLALGVSRRSEATYEAPFARQGIITIYLCWLGTLPVIRFSSIFEGWLGLYPLAGQSKKALNHVALFNIFLGFLVVFCVQPI